MPTEIKIVAGPHSHGLTLQLSEDILVYVGLPAPKGVSQMSDADIETHARRGAVRALEVAIDQLQADEHHRRLTEAEQY